MPAEGDNPTIGLIFCSRKNEAIANYSVLSEARQIFAAKRKLDSVLRMDSAGTGPMRARCQFL
jgi:hypothetical protein